MKTKSIVRTEETTGQDKRLALFLVEEDALLIYKLLNGYQLVDGSGERLQFLIKEMYEDTFDNRLTEPWEWED